MALPTFPVNHLVQLHILDQSFRAQPLASAR